MARDFSILGWIFGIFFLLAALVALLNLHLVSFMSALITGVMLLPKGPDFVGDVIHKQISNSARWVIIFVILVLGIALFYTIGMRISIFK